MNVCTKMVSVLSRHSDAHHAARRPGGTIVAHRGASDQKFEPKRGALARQRVSAVRSLVSSTRQKSCWRPSTRVTGICSQYLR